MHSGLWKKNKSPGSVLPQRMGVPHVVGDQGLAGRQAGDRALDTAQFSGLSKILFFFGGGHLWTASKKFLHFSFLVFICMYTNSTPQGLRIVGEGRVTINYRLAENGLWIAPRSICFGENGQVMFYGIPQARRVARSSTRRSTCSVASGPWCPRLLPAPCRTSNAPQKSGIDYFFCICSHGCWRKLGPCRASCPTSVTSTK